METRERVLSLPFVEYPPTKLGPAPGRDMFEAVFPSLHSMPAQGDLLCYPGVRIYERVDRVAVKFPRNAASLLGASIPGGGPRAIDPAWLEVLSHFQLRRYQWEAISFLLGAHGALLNLVIGGGKTRSLLGAAKLVGGRTLIITLRSLAETWRRELERVGELDGRDDLRWAELCGFLPALTPAGISEADLAAQGLHPEARWVFIHPELVWSWDWALRDKFTVAIVDEAHLFKNAHTKRGQAVRTAVQTAKHVWLSTGTPILNRPCELWALLDVALLGGFGSETEHRIRYNGAERAEFAFKDGDLTHQDELRQRLTGVVYARTRAQIGLELPSCSTRLLAHESNASLVAASERVLGADPVLVLETLLQGKSLGPRAIEYLSAMRVRASKDKIPTTVEHIGSLVEQGESVVVFVAYRDTAQQIADGVCRYTGSAGVTVTGADPPKLREAALGAFFAFDAKVLVATYDVLGVGVNLQGAARCVVHHDLTWVPATHAQATGCVWRSGQDRDVIVDYIFAKGTLDEILARALVEKVRLIDASGEDVTDYQSFKGLVVQSDVERWFANK